MSSFLQCIAEYKPLVDFFQALLTPVIAIVVAWIAWRQHLTSQRQLQLARYERQFAAYKALMNFLAEFLNTADGTVSVIANNNLHDAWSESHFIFDGDEIPKYLLEVWKSGLHYGNAQRRLRNPNVGPDEKNQAQKQATELEQYFDKQHTEAREKFRKYLQLQ